MNQIKILSGLLLCALTSVFMSTLAFAETSTVPQSTPDTPQNQTKPKKQFSAVQGPYINLSFSAGQQQADLSKKTAGSISIDPSADGNTDPDLSIAVGYHFTPLISFELGRYSFGKIWGEERSKWGDLSSPNGGLQSYDISSKIEVEATIPWLVLHKMLGQNIEISGRIGYGFYSARYGTSGHIKIIEPGTNLRYGYDEANSGRSDAFSLGFGSRWHYNKHWAVGAHYQYHAAEFSDNNNDADWDLHRFGVDIQYNL